MTQTKADPFYLTACYYCGVAVSNARKPADPEWANAKAICPDCYADRPPDPNVNEDLSDPAARASSEPAQASVR